MITKENYEAYFLDYHEGNLSAEVTAELMLFLEQHPEFQDDFDSFEALKLEASAVTFENKGNIKKNIALDENDYIAYIENTADYKTKTKVEKAITLSSEVNAEIALFKKTILVPEKIEFPNKSQLKRKEGKVISLYYAVAAAAAIAILLVGTFLYNRNIETTPQLAVSDKVIVKDEVQVVHKKETSTVKENTLVKSSSAKAKKSSSTNKALNEKMSTPTSNMNNYYKLTKHNKLSIPLQAKSGVLDISDGITEVDGTALLTSVDENISPEPTEELYLNLREQLISQMTDIKTGKPKKEERILLLANITKKLFKKAPVKTRAEYDQNNNIVAYSVDFRNIHFEKK